MIRSHYIPQFILRSFCEKDKIQYCDFEKKSKETRNVYSVFSEKGYYSDEMEHDLCKKAEYIFANLYHNKIENARYTITLTRDELFILKKYLIVSAIRYRRSNLEEIKAEQRKYGEAFVTDFENNLKVILESENADTFESYLRKMIEKYHMNLSMEEIGQSKDINVPLWAEMKDICQSYVVFLQAPEGEEFIIPDVGRGVYIGPFGYKKIDAMLESSILMPPDMLWIMQSLTPRDYSVFPVSKKMAILTMSSFYLIMTDKEILRSEHISQDDSMIGDMLGFGHAGLFSGPEKKPMRPAGIKYIYEVKKAKPEDIAHLNALMIAQAENNIAFSNSKNLMCTKEKAPKYTEKDIGFIWR